MKCETIAKVALFFIIMAITMIIGHYCIDNAPSAEPDLNIHITDGLFVIGLPELGAVLGGAGIGLILGLIVLPCIRALPD